jgi:hypothetical protein
MTIPQANYVVDKEGQKIFVQLSLQDWENFVNEFKRVESLLFLKSKLKNAFREIRQIQKGEKQGTTLNNFLNEL